MVIIPFCVRIVVINKERLLVLYLTAFKKKRNIASMINWITPIFKKIYFGVKNYNCSEKKCVPGDNS